MRRVGVRGAALFCALAAAVVLGAALASERWGGLVPCALCLWERWPYRVAVGLSVVALVVPQRLARFMLGLVALTFVVSAGVAFLHIGVEQHWWPSPLPECMAPRITAGSFAERLAQMPALPSKACEDPVYLLAWLPVSMAQMNLIASLALAGVVSIWLGRTRGVA